MKFLAATIGGGFGLATSPQPHTAPQVDASDTRRSAIAGDRAFRIDLRCRSEPALRGPMPSTSATLPRVGRVRATCIRIAGCIGVVALLCAVGCGGESSADGGDAGVSGPDAGCCSDLANAPPGFAYKGKQAVPIDIEAIDLALAFDTSTKRATGRATITFHADSAGLPFLDLVADPTALTLDGEVLPPAALAAARTPGDISTIRILRREVGANSDHRLEVAYDLPATYLRFAGDGVTVAYEADDSSERSFWEQLGPANFEFDHFRLTIDVTVTGGADHSLFVNGDLEERGPGSFHVAFPVHFTTSSFYFYLAPSRNIRVEQGIYHGVRDVSVTVFADAANDLTGIMADTDVVLAELETAYGAYPHNALIVRFDQEYDDADTGMEYAGATTTGRGALGHELLHQWFGRGVMPVDGNAGFIDEAIAQWRDDGYPRATVAPESSPRARVNLGGFSPYRRSTAGRAYEHGAALLAELDFALASRDGLRPVLRHLYEQRANTSITVSSFREFLEGETGRDLGPVFAKYVFGAP